MAPDRGDAVTFGHELRSAFALDPAIAFLNHGSFGATPRVVLAAQQRLRDEMERNPVAFLARDLPVRLRRAAERLASFVGADASEVVFVDNATTGVAAVVGSLPLRVGDRIVTTTHVYPAVRNVLRRAAAASGAELVEVPIPFPLEADDEVVDRVVAALPGARLAVLDWITSASGLVMPIERLVAACRAVGVPVLVDGAHALGHVEMDLGRLGADWVTANAHKWLFAPKGCALLWARADRQNDLRPTVVSHGYGRGFVEEFGWTGTKDPTAWLAVEAALDFVEEVEFSSMCAHNPALADEAANLLSRRLGLARPAPPSMCANLVTLPLPDGVVSGTPTPATAEALSARLSSQFGVEVPVFPLADRLWFRISAQIYNELPEYERLAQALMGILVLPTR